LFGFQGNRAGGLFVGGLSILGRPSGPFSFQSGLCGRVLGLLGSLALGKAGFASNAGGHPGSISISDGRIVSPRLRAKTIELRLLGFCSRAKSVGKTCSLKAVHPVSVRAGCGAAI
jgi:hypothetical protein